MCMRIFVFIVYGYVIIVPSFHIDILAKPASSHFPQCNARNADASFVNVCSMKGAVENATTNRSQTSSPVC